MLESLRAIQNTWVGKTILAVVMGLIMVSFVIWGIGDIFRGFNANQIASVGGTPIAVETFRQAYQTELQRLQQRARRPITNVEAHQAGIDSQVLSRLVSEAILDHEADAMGLSISDQQIAKAILDDPTFKGPTGQFDRQTFNATLRDNGFNEQGFVREQRAVYLRQELVQGIVGAVTVPKAALDALDRFQTETRSIDYVVLPASAAGDIPAPDEGTLQKYFDAHPQAYRAPEYRKLAILPLLPSTLAKPDQVSDADVQARYDSVKDTRYTTPEYRTLQQIVFPKEEEATAASQKIKAGSSFADIAAERTLTDKDTDLGRLTKAAVFEKAVGDAAFALPEGGTSDPVKNAFGATIVHVAKIDAGVTKPLAEVAGDLRQEIAAARTGDAIRTLHDKVEDARASGQSLADAAKAAGLAVRTIDAVDAGGRDKAGQPVADLPDGPALLKAAFASDVGVDNDTVATRDGGQIFFEVAATEPARTQTLAEVRPKAETGWRAEQVDKALTAKAAELVQALDSGKTIEEVAASLALPVQHAADVRRSGGTGINRATAAAAFDGPVGSAATATGQDTTRVVLKVLGSVTPPLDAESDPVKQLDTQYQAWLSEDMIAAYLGDVQARLGVKVNPAAFAAAVGAGS